MSKSGSRYGRRSNWFKIHCLLQEQQQQQQQQQQNLQSQQLQQHDTTTTTATTAIGGLTDAIDDGGCGDGGDGGGINLRVTAGTAAADADATTFGGLLVPDCQHLGVITATGSNITSTTTISTNTTTNSTIDGVSISLISKNNNSNNNNNNNIVMEDLINLQQQIEIKLRADKELITPIESSMSVKHQQQPTQVTTIGANILTSTAKFLNSVMVGASNNSNNNNNIFSHTQTNSSDSGASSVDDGDVDDIKSHFNWNEEDSLYKTDIEMERKEEKRRRRLLQKFLRPHSEPLRSPVPVNMGGLSPQRNVSKIATLTPLLNIGLFPLYANSLRPNDIDKSYLIKESNNATLQQEEPIDLSLKSNYHNDLNAQQVRIRRNCTKQKLSVPLDLRIERSSRNKLSR